MVLGLARGLYQGVMADYPQESYTALADLPVYGNVNIEEPQEAYTVLVDDQSNRPITQTAGHAPQQTNAHIDDEQCIYENYSGDKTKVAGPQSHRIKTSVRSSKPSSPAPKADRESCDRIPSVEKDFDKKTETENEECKVIPNLYGPDPISGPITEMTQAEWILPVRKSTRPASAKEKRSVRRCSVVFGVLLAISVIGNIILICLKFRVPPITETERRRKQVESLQNKWLAGGIAGNTINTGILMNVASVYNGATCNASSMLLTSAHAHDRHWCHYAIDGREDTDQPHSWAPGLDDKRKPYIEVVFDTNYTVAIVELVGNISLKESWRLSLTFSDGSSQNFLRQKGNRSAENILRDVITVEPVTTNSMRITFIETDSADHQLKLLELRVFAYGDRPQTAESCCPQDFIYSPSLNHCYFFPDVETKSLMKPDNAKTECSKMNSTLLSIHSLAEHDFLRSHFTRMTIGALDKTDLRQVQRTDFWTSLYRHPINSTYWKWADGYNMTYQSWGLDQPTSRYGEPCMQLRASQSFDWNDKSCGSELLYACDTPALC